MKMFVSMKLPSGKLWAQWWERLWGVKLWEQHLAAALARSVESRRRDNEHQGAQLDRFSRHRPTVGDPVVGADVGAEDGLDVGCCVGSTVGAKVAASFTPRNVAQSTS